MTKYLRSYWFHKQMILIKVVIIIFLNGIDILSLMKVIENIYKNTMHPFIDT